MITIILKLLIMTLLLLLLLRLVLPNKTNKKILELNNRYPFEEKNQA